MTKRLRLFEAFAGYGSQRMALRNIGVEFESVGISEVDISVIISYAAIHDGLANCKYFEYPSKYEMVSFLESRRIGLDFKSNKVKLPKSLDKLKLIYKATILSNCVGDIMAIDPHRLPDFDIFTYSFPCTDLSVAGQMQGMIRGGTRSGLLYECEKIIEVKKPKYLLLENVKSLVSKKFKDQFNDWLVYLESLGYTNYYKVLNAKEFGIPQNRERVFVVSILNDDKCDFTFPEGQPLRASLSDILESDVEDKYYLSDEVQKRFKPNSHFFKGGGNIVGTTAPSFRKIGARDVCYSPDSVVGTLLSTDYKQPKQIIERVVRVGGCFDTDTAKRQAGSVYDTKGLSPTITTMEGGYRQPCIVEDKKPTILIPQATKEGYIEMELPGICDLSYPNSTTRRGQVQDKGASCPTLTTGKKDICYVDVNNVGEYRVRRLTPRECWRLMGVSDTDFDKAKEFNSDSQLYKQAGNSIVVPVLEGIFENMLGQERLKNEQ